MRKILYLGTDPKEFQAEGVVTHYPVIQIVPRPWDTPEIQESYADLERYTHFIFTSKNAVCIFWDHICLLQQENIVKRKPCIAVGKVTASHLEQRGIPHPLVAQEETQEGVIALLGNLDLTDAYLFIPKSSLSRTALFKFLDQEGIAYRACSIYDTEAQFLKPKPQLKDYDLVVFTSPSTVEAFVLHFGQLPSREKCQAIGPITEQTLQQLWGIFAAFFPILSILTFC